MSHNEIKPYLHAKLFRGSELTLLETLSAKYGQSLSEAHIIGSGCFGCVFDLADDTVVKLTADLEEISSLATIREKFIDHPGLVKIHPDSITYGTLPEIRFAFYRMERLIPLWDAGLGDSQFEEALDTIDVIRGTIDKTKGAYACSEKLAKYTNRPYAHKLISLLQAALQHNLVFSDIHHGNVGFRAFERYTPLLEEGLILFDPVLQPRAAVQKDRTVIK